MTDGRLEQMRCVADHALGVPFSTGNTVTVLRNGDEIFPAMLGAVAVAQRTVEFLTFIYWTGEIAERFAQALADAALRGVQVRVLLDSYGAQPMNQELLDRMEQAGVVVAWFRPLARLNITKTDHRTHRKVLVVDHTVAFTGGVGIAAEWEGDARHEGEYRETHLAIIGPAVPHLRSAFISNWIEAEQPLPSDLSDPDRCPPPAVLDGPLIEAARLPGRDNTIADVELQTLRSTASIKWSDAYLLQQLMIQQARNTIRITTAYFVPHDDTVQMLCDAARRGVDTRILMPGEHTDEGLCNLAGKDVFATLLEAGVQVYMFEPTMIHAKVITIDGCCAVLGSANFNHRSIQKDDEICLLALSAPLAQLLDAQFDDDLKRSHQVTPEDWENRSWLQWVKEVAVKPIKSEL